MHLCPNCSFVVNENIDACPKCAFSFSKVAALDLRDEDVYRGVMAAGMMKSAFEIEKIRRWVLVIGICSLVLTISVLLIGILAIATY